MERLADTGYPGDSKLFDSQLVSQLNHILGPVEDLATELEIGESHARPTLRAYIGMIQRARS